MVHASSIADKKAQLSVLEGYSELLKSKTSKMSADKDVKEGFIAKAQKRLNEIDATIARLEEPTMSIEEAVERLALMKEQRDAEEKKVKGAEPKNQS